MNVTMDSGTIPAFYCEALDLTVGPEADNCPKSLQEYDRIVPQIRLRFLASMSLKFTISNHATPNWTV
jgi:hypothetical protein